MTNEREIQLGVPGVFLSSHRIRYGISANEFTSIMLENITRIAAKKQEYPALLVLGLVLLVIGVIAVVAGGQQGVGALFICGLLGVLFVVGYFGTRNTILFIASADGGGIGIQAGHMPAERMREYVSMIEEAMDARRQAGATQPAARNASPALTNKSVPRGATLPVGKSFRVAKAGNDLGEYKVLAIKQMFTRGDLSMQDHYFDSDANEWMPLDCLPDVA